EGPLTPRDLAEGTPRFRAFVEIEAEEDERTLEAMWRYRDVLDVLLTGSQGTEFAGAVWQIVDAEISRVAAMNCSMQEAGICRRALEPEIFGSLIVGTYLLVAKQMTRMARKPDLALWARSLHSLIREGATPRELTNERPSKQRPKQKRAPARRKAAGRRPR